MKSVEVFYLLEGVIMCCYYKFEKSWMFDLDGVMWEVFFMYY